MCVCVCVCIYIYISFIKRYTQISNKITHRISKFPYNIVYFNINIVVLHYIKFPSHFAALLGMPSTNNIARSVNLRRKTQRPEDPANLDFILDRESIGEALIKGDIWVEDERGIRKRHIILASDYQLELLRTARHWSVATFNIIY